MDHFYKKQNRALRILLMVTTSSVLLLLIAIVFIGWQISKKPDQRIDSPGFLTPNKVQAREVAPRGDLTPSERETIALFDAANPSVVFITTLAVRRDFLSLDIHQIPRGNGTGIIWDKKGHIVTNFHVVQGADAARITFSDGSTHSASLVGQAAENDLAVLKIKISSQKLRPIPIGSSTDLLVGQSVFAIGNPFGLDQTLSQGVISGLGREIPAASGGSIKGVIQTDAVINPGNSGGPLLDSAGRLIGVNTAIFSPTGSYAGIGFAIPVDVVNRIVPQLITHGRVIRPRMGIQIADDSLIRQLGMEGVLIMGIEEGGPAHQAGLRGTMREPHGRIILGDIIVGMDNHPVTNSGDLFRQLDQHQPGETVLLQIRRQRAELEVKVKLAPGS